MADTNIKFTINFNASRGKPTGAIEEVKKDLFNAVTYAINDIAFKAARNQQRNIQNQIESKIGGIVMSELSAMGRQITSQAIGLGPGQRHPTGRLELESPVSSVFQRIRPDVARPMNISTVTGDWRARTKEYLQRKAKKFGHRKWWMSTGDLRNQLRNPSMWTAAYGPIRVLWRPERIENSYSPGAALRYSGLARGQGQSYTLSVGKVEMHILGRITRQMLNEPDARAYDSRFNGLLESLPESVEKKLANKGDPYRAVIEPFLTYYINRRIPNRIFNEITGTLSKKDTAGRKVNYSAVRSVGARR